MKWRPKRSIRPIFSYKRGISFEKCLDDPIPLIIPKVDITVHRYNLLEVVKRLKGGDYLKDLPRIEKISQVAYRIYRNKCEVFLATSNGKVVHHIFLGMGSQKNSIFGSYTLPDYRGKRIYPKVLSHIANYLKEEGHKAVFVGAPLKNSSAISGIKRAGFKEYKRNHCLVILGRVVRKPKIFRRLKKTDAGKIRC